MPATPTPSRTLLATAAWIFLGWTAIGAVVMAVGIDVEWVRRAALPPWVEAPAVAILNLSDALWITLGAGLALASETRRVGARPALRSFAILAVAAGAAEWIGATTGLLFGDYAYTDRFGLRLGGVLPYTIPLAWYLVLTGAAEVADKFPLGKLGRLLAVGGLAVVTDINLEPVAIHVRGYWFWNGDPTAAPPLFNYLTWFLLAAVLSPVVGRRHEPETPTEDPRGLLLSPATLLLAMNALFLVAHLGRWVRE